MSARTKGMDAASSPSRSSKKRKIDGEASTKSKKKRKHADTPDKQSQLQELSAPKSKSTTKRKEKKEKQEGQENKEKKEKKKKKKKREEVQVEATQDVETEDIELPDIATSQTLVQETQAEDETQEQEVPQELIETFDEGLLRSADPTAFHTKRMSLYLPIPAISLSSPTSSLLSTHLTPLLLTYYPPAEGVIVAFSDPVLSAKPEAGVNQPLQVPESGIIPKNPPDETFAQCADQFGVCWVWLTITFLVFAPKQGDMLKARINVQSESFIGLVSYNYFQTSIGKERIPQRWTYDGPTREQKRKVPRKQKLRGETANDEDIEPASSQVESTQDQAEVGAGDGVFMDEDGQKISSTQTIRVAGVEIVPGSERNKFGMQLEGSLLSAEEEGAVVAEERRRFEAIQRRGAQSQAGAADEVDLPLMSGAITLSREMSEV